MTTTATLGVSGVPWAQILLPVPAHHPSASGPMLVDLELDADVVEAARLRIDHAHRGVEKLFEVRDLRQCTSLASRHAWLSGIASEVGLCEVVETMLGLTVPSRALWLRALWCEITRITHHLAFAGSMLGWSDPAPLGASQREGLLRVMELATGARIHHSASCIGGVGFDVDASWCDGLLTALPSTDGLRSRIDLSWRGIGVLTADDVHAYGVTGPVARASGVAGDVRRGGPYDVLTVPCRTQEEGDVLARVEQLLDEIDDSVVLCREMVEELPEGEIRVRTPKTLRVPEGTGYAATESPGGVNGWWLVSRGAPAPHRLALRTAGWGIAQACEKVLVGCRAQEVAVVLGSMFLVSGDVAK